MRELVVHVSIRYAADLEFVDDISFSHARVRQRQYGYFVSPVPEVHGQIVRNQLGATYNLRRKSIGTKTNFHGLPRINLQTATAPKAHQCSGTVAILGEYINKDLGAMNGVNAIAEINKAFFSTPTAIAGLPRAKC